MDQWLTEASPLLRYLIGVSAIMAGGILLVAAFLFKPGPKRFSLLPSMVSQLRTIPPPYEAMKPSTGRLAQALDRERRRRDN